MVAAAGVAVMVAGLYGQSQWENSVALMNVANVPLSPIGPASFSSEAAEKESQPVFAQPAQPAPQVTAIPASEPAESFTIDVALFSSRGRASALAADLTGANYPAYVKDLVLEDRHMFEVVVGPFSSRADADAGVARIRAIPGYDDARVVASGP
jgi:cell division septation protein DedD